MSLTVGIDARKVRDYGIGRYLQGLLGGLDALEGEERYVLFLPEPSLAALPGGLPARLSPDRFRTVRCGAGLNSPAELFAFRGSAARHGLDVLHFPHYVRGFAPGCPVVVTIHDAIHLAFPRSPAAWLVARALLGLSARSAAALLTVSESARDDLSVRLGVPRDRFRVTPNGIAPSFAPPEREAIARFRRERGLEEPFVLCVASHRKHKNLSGAVRAFRLAGLGGADLVVPARDGEAARALAPHRDAAAPFRILVGVRDEDLPPLYAAARVVLIPSLAEGFGLPALEAAACGAAVLAVGIPAHREVLGDAAALAPDGDPETLARELAALWADGDRRARIAERGPARAALFRWDRTARLTRDAYREAARRAHPLV